MPIPAGSRQMNLILSYLSYINSRAPVIATFDLWLRYVCTARKSRLGGAGYSMYSNPVVLTLARLHGQERVV